MLKVLVTPREILCFPWSLLRRNHLVTNLLYFNEYSGNPTFCFNEMGILDTDLNNINLDDTNYDESDHEYIIHIRLLVWHIKFEN